MKSFFAIATGLLAAGPTVLAAPKTKGEGFISKFNLTPAQLNDTKEYIVTFARGEPIPKQIDEYMDMMELSRDDDIIYTNMDTNRTTGTTVIIVNACAAHAEAFGNLTEVFAVESNAVIQSFVTQQPESPWGLQRISSEAGASGSPQSQDFTYSYEDEALGAGVDIYILDTGVRTSHAVFTGRATEGFTATGSFTDGDGHGTHVAGTAAGAKFGVAQGANVFEVKVLGDDGSGASSDTIQGMDWVVANHEKRKTQPGFVGSIMSMSWGLQGFATSVDEMIAGASEAGIHVSVAAGNDGVDACTGTPAHLGGGNSNVVTVGSVNIDNEISTFSNIGKCVDIYAPGEQILSSWSTGDNVVNFLSGTSMACPHTTGVMATLMAQDPAGLGQDPAALKAKLLEVAREGKLTGDTGGSANLLLSNGVDGNVAKRLTKNYVVPEHSGLSGSPAARAAARMANDITIDKRFQLHSRDSQLRF